MLGTSLASAGPVTIKAPILVDTAPKPRITIDIRLLPPFPSDDGSCCYDPPGSSGGSDEPSDEPTDEPYDEPTDEPGGDSDGNPLTP
jgi:hypothetical protein